MSHSMLPHSHPLNYVVLLPSLVHSMFPAKQRLRFARDTRALLSTYNLYCIVKFKNPHGNVFFSRRHRSVGLTAESIPAKFCTSTPWVEGFRGNGVRNLAANIGF